MQKHLLYYPFFQSQDRSTDIFLPIQTHSKNQSQFFQRPYAPYTGCLQNP